ncbi:Dihydroorotate dehydrogenase (quinone), mitochondrial [Cytospora paraplurivora]|uniref:Dihydroorotate dehydrogenase (Quinone), mitochondrial n=1 Tax=Cytospora paraplurivora TaxID=2898453 RepID=A0AAN9UE44_9PEZI
MYITQNHNRNDNNNDDDGHNITLGMAASPVYRAILRRPIHSLRDGMRQRRWNSNKNNNNNNNKPEPVAPAPTPETTASTTDVPFYLRLGPVTRAAQAYGRAGRRRPWLTQFLTFLTIYSVADVNAQRIGGKEYEPERTARAVTIGGISAVPIYESYLWLNRTFVYRSRVLSIAAQIVFAQAVFTPLFNAYFFGMQALLAGDTLAGTWDRIKRTVPKTMVNSCKLWPFVNVINFSVMPVEFRGVFAGVVAMGWQTYLTWLNRQAEEEEDRARKSTIGFGTAALSVSLAATLYISYLYATDTRSSYHQWLVPPLLRAIYSDAEDAHHIGLVALKFLRELGLNPRERPARAGVVPEPSDLAVTVFDRAIANPIAISAGLDKDADIPDALFDLGAGIVEVGGCTPRPQDGNPRPRSWRVPAVEGLVNRNGLNSRGADAMAARLRDRARRFARALGLTERQVLDGEGVDVPPGSLLPGRLLAVQVAKQKETDERDVEAVARDYVYCVNRLAPYADVLVVNVSSPNTPGLRDLQAAGPLGRILGAVVEEARRTDRRVKPRVMVKVSPDEDEDAQVEGIVQAVYLSGVDGVIVGNTTKRRAGLVPQGVRLNAREQQALAETGGFSGPAMFSRTLDLVARYRKLLDGAALQAADGKEEPPKQKVIFATGGIKNGEQALKVLNAGASVAMIYTSMVYGGAGTVTRIKGEMRSALTDGKTEEKA